VRNGHPAASCGTHAAAKYDARWRADAGTLAWVRVVITEIAWDGSIRRRALDTGSLTDPGRCESLLGQVLAIPPPYRAAPGRPVYVLHAGDRAVVVGEDNLTGSLRQLVTTVLAAGDQCLARPGPAAQRPGTGHMTAPVILTEARPGYGKAVLVYWVNVCPAQPG
jgi:hypothetical protein